MNLETRIDALYSSPLDSFVAARNALAAELKREGRADDAARVKRLTRPTLPAWAINQVYWHARDVFAQLTAAGDRMRDVQRKALSGRDVDVRESTRERQQAVRDFVDRATALVREHGQTVTDASRQRIAVTADAIAAFGSRPREYSPGRLERELDPPGFEALAGLAAGAPALRLVKPAKEAPSHPEPPARGRRHERDTKAGRAENEREKAAAREAERRQREALRAATQARDARQRDLEKARRAEAQAAERLRDLRRELEPLQRRLATLEEKARAAETVLEEARRDVTTTAKAFEDASATVDELT